MNCFSSFAESPGAWNSGGNACLWKGGTRDPPSVCPGGDYFISGLPEAGPGLLDSLGLDTAPGLGTAGRPGVCTAWRGLGRLQEGRRLVSRPQPPPPLSPGAAWRCAPRAQPPHREGGGKLTTGLLSSSMFPRPKSLLHRHQQHTVLLQYERGARETHLSMCAVTQAGARTPLGDPAANTQAAVSMLAPHPFRALLSLPHSAAGGHSAVTGGHSGPSSSGPHTCRPCTPRSLPPSQATLL